MSYGSDLFEQCICIGLYRKLCVARTPWSNANWNFLRSRAGECGALTSCPKHPRFPYLAAIHFAEVNIYNFETASSKYVHPIARYSGIICKINLHSSRWSAPTNADKGFLWFHLLYSVLEELIRWCHISSGKRGGPKTPSINYAGSIAYPENLLFSASMEVLLGI